jgi:hypothetical protein
MTATTSRPGPRVLIEGRDPVASAAQARLLAQHGVEVQVCRGPRRLPGGGCPLLSEGSYSLVEGADVVLFDLDLDDADEREALLTTRLRYPDVPIVVEVPLSARRRHADVLAGVRTVPPISPEHLTEALLAALPSGRRTASA